jgi:hypothetical protein
MNEANFKVGDIVVDRLSVERIVSIDATRIKTVCVYNKTNYHYSTDGKIIGLPQHFIRRYTNIYKYLYITQPFRADYE